MKIIPESKRNELKYSLKIAFMLLSIIVRLPNKLKYIAFNSRKGDRVQWSLVRDSGKQHAEKTRKNVIFTIFHVFCSILDNKAIAFFGRSCEYKIVCFSLKDFRQQSPSSLPHERRRAVFSAVEKNNLKLCMYSRY